MKSRRVAGAVLAFLALSGCAGDGGARDEQTLSPAEASVRVSELLYQQNLITYRQVNEKMNEYVLAVSRDGVPADSVMPGFHRWLEAWTRTHPHSVAAARLEPAVQLHP